MEIDPNTSLQSTFLVAKDVLASGILREVYSDGEVKRTIASKTIAETGVAVEVPERLVAQENTVSSVAPTNEDAALRPATTEPLSHAVQRAETALSPERPTALPDIEISSQTRVADNTLTAMRNALIGPPPPWTQDLVLAADKERPRPNAAVLAVAAVGLFRDSTGKWGPDGSASTQSNKPKDQDSSPRNEIVEEKKTADGIKSLYKAAHRAYAASQSAPFVI